MNLAEVAVKMEITALLEKHYPEVSRIYVEGQKTGVATFETTVPNWEQWSEKFLTICRCVVLIDNQVVAWCALSAVSNREVYKGVAEDTIYVDTRYQGKGIGKTLLTHLVSKSEKEGLWTLQAGIFSENKASIKLHQGCGFRILGIREKIAQRGGKWHDNVLMERRASMNSAQASSVTRQTNLKIEVGTRFLPSQETMRNILVLCTGNSCRSQMAHGYLKKFAEGRATIYSAGIETHGLNPGAVKTMTDDGIDISHYTSNLVDDYASIEFDFIITVCDHALENCPFIPSKNAVRLHHNFSDPSKVKGSDQEISEAFIKTREEIKNYCKDFANDKL